MINLFNTLAQATAPAKPEGIQAIIGSGPFMFAVMIIMFYFLLIRPQQRQRKEQAARIAALKNGDKVVTTAGLHGLVHNVKEKTVMVKVAEGTNLEFDKAAIASVIKKEA
ncbi:preprotein translocase subunit YajC [Luteolibacter algae]|uniref:Sec translocon accessory complex subunit YajC n=1 Tax=Luteolibacter algae TaxID=454151 RepID=A0ABW5DEJ9_9BACT